MRLIPAVDDLVWQQAAPLLQQALYYAGNTHTLADVREAINSNDAQLWLGEHSAAVTEIYDYPRCKGLHIWLAAGSMDEIVRGTEPVACFARMAGCAHVSITGRPGWQRVLRRHGYSVSGINLSRNLS